MGIAALFRMAGAGWRLAREGAFSLVDTSELPNGPQMAVRIGRIIERRGLTDETRSERLTEALHDLGPSYVKLGQFLATRPDLVGKPMAAALGRLRDEVEPFPETEARATVERALEKPVDELFASFSAPLAAASIAQVHKASIVADEAERWVAVKVLRPGIRRRFQRDLESFYAGARLIERIDPASRRLRPIAVVDTLARTVQLEMDLRLEAAALSETAEAVADDPGFRVPTIDWTRTGRDVLTLEWIDGIKLSDLEALKDAGYDLTVLSERLMQAFLRQALRDGFFHADMHQGNLFVDNLGDIVAIDYGIVGRLDADQRLFLAEVLYGFIRRDYKRIAEVHFRAGYVPADRYSIEDFAQALRAIGEPIHGHRASDISMAKLLSLLFEVTELFDMQTRPELILVQKTMVVVEGVARSLDPEFDMWAAAEPVVKEWLEREIGPAGQLNRASAGMEAVGRLVSEMPRLAEGTRRLSAEMERMSEHGLRLDAETVREIGRSEARASRWSRLALVILAAVALVAALKVLF